jgi:predicted transcriptional regulator
VPSAGNRDLLRIIAEQAPGSLDALARITGKTNQPLSQTLRTRKSDRLVRPQRDERGRITPTAPHDRVERDRGLT